MKKEYNKEAALSNLRLAIELIENDAEQADISNILIHTLGEGVCDLNCIATNASFFQTILDMLPIPVYYKDIYGVFVGCNEALAKLYKRKKSEIIGKTVFDFFTKQEAEVFSYSDMVLLNETSHEMVEHKGRFSALGGSYHILHKKIILGRDGRPAGVLGIISDISEQKQSEERAWQGEAFYKSLYDQSPRACVIFNAFNVIEDMNYAAFKLFGEDSSYVGSDITSIFRRYEDFEKMMNSGGEPVRVEIIGSGSEVIESVASLTVSGVSAEGKYAVSFISIGSFL